MKNIIINCSFLITMLASCSPATDKKVNTADSTEAKKADTVTTQSPAKNEITKPEMPGDFLTLVPIDVLNPKSTNVHEKYGIEFSGNCYSCDLASISITNNTMVWTNVCDEKDTFKINDFSFTNEGSQTTIKTTERTYILKQIDKAPVYELSIEGNKLELKNKRISKYFTTQKALPLFTEHDCGDFEG